MVMEDAVLRVENGVLGAPRTSSFGSSKGGGWRVLTA